MGLHYNFVAYYLDEAGKVPMMTGKIHGTVLSGHPTQTTTFNTVRVFLMTLYLCHLLPKDSWFSFIAGDDMLLRFCKKYLPIII